MSTGRLAHLTQEERADAGRAALRRAGWHIAPSPSPRPSAPRPPRAGLDSPEVIARLHEDLRSSLDGTRLGRRWQHNPFSFAASLGLAIEYRPLAELQNPSRPTITILGRLVKIPGQPRYIQLADSLGGQQTHATLAHEIAHALGIQNERCADQFGMAFMTVHDDETAAGRWRILDRECVRRAREDSVRHARGLAAVGGYY